MLRNAINIALCKTLRMESTESMIQYADNVVTQGVPGLSWNDTVRKQVSETTSAEVCVIMGIQYLRSRFHRGCHCLQKGNVR